MCHVRANAKQHYGEAFVNLLPRVQKLGYSEAQLQRCLDYIRDEAPIIIHFDLQKCIDFFIKDTHYRNQFETGTSAGCLSRGSRTQWENDLFNNAYNNAADFDRVKYGVMNVVNDPAGITSAYQYGNCYMVLKHVRLRCSLSAQDSGAGRLEMLACCDYYAHVLHAFSDPELEAVMQVGNKVQNYVASSVISQYKECQIHGEVALGNDVAAFVIHGDYHGNVDMGKKLEKLGKTHNVPILWMDQVDPAAISQVAELERTRSMEEARKHSREQSRKPVDPAEVAKIEAEQKEMSERESAAAAAEAEAEEKAAMAAEAESLANFIEVTGCLDVHQARATLASAGGKLDAAIEAYLAQAAKPAGGPVEVSEDDIMQLVSMGFEYEQSKLALISSEGEFGPAMEHLLGSG
eukprot:TRINITY_DN24596_c0_g1_i1.p1 TRINITY_DN24596_c0_g1~~TRINITY_DN24596_c0_g1_i1.p1  ORF type:complete len:406 (+),score=101.50 TRINITY_DN24596_c0_g1_i1:249-1466(+)